MKWQLPSVIGAAFLLQAQTLNDFDRTFDEQQAMECRVAQSTLSDLAEQLQAFIAAYNRCIDAKAAGESCDREFQDIKTFHADYGDAAHRVEMYCKF
jgi:hypothetical protein